MTLAQHKNEVHLAGVVHKEPTIRATATGKKVANVIVATTTTKHHKELHRVVAWEDLADKCERLSAGEFVQVVGRLQTRPWEDSKGKHYATEVVAWQLIIPGKEAVTVSTTGVEVTDADIPF